MKNLLVGIRNRITTIGWAFSLAWKFNKLLLVFSFIMLTLASILPAIAISYNKEIIRGINVFIQDNVGSFDDILATIIFYGLFTTLVGFSNRLNEDFIYSIMFDSYYFGMEEILMDSVQSYSMKELLNKTTNDEFNSCVMREGELTDFISGFCILWGRIVTFISLIIVSVSISVSVSIISSIYIILVILYNLFVSNRIRSFWNEIRASERLANYYENLFMVSECAKEMRVFGSCEYIHNKWNEAYLPIFEYEKKENFNGELRIFISSIGYYSFLAIVLVLSVLGISHKTLTVDTVLVVFSLGLNIFTTVKNVAKTIVVTERGLFSLESQHKFFDKHTQHKIEDDAVVSSNNRKTVFEGKNLSFSYNEKDIVLDN